MKTWKIEIMLNVADSWVADGFNASDSERLEQIEECISNMLPYAYEHEVKVKATVVKHPPKEQILKLQGYIN